MATLTAEFRAETERIHKEHLALEQLLTDLDVALDRLICYSEVFTDMAGADEVRRCGRLLARVLPDHCRREEATLLDRVSDVSPQLRAFCQEMRQEHAVVLARLQRLTATLDELDRAEDLSEAIWHLKEQGKELTAELRRHISVEERELSGFL
ncbi:MAG TPA: hemerythrin domain-containing protein [Candidatus Acidoferrales bacterium]|nr:hemerythrin domain-containing protein [Candidatus Acidoferrales bacterium]